MLALAPRLSSFVVSKLAAPLTAVMLIASTQASFAQSGAKFEEPDEASLAELIFATMDVNFSGLLTEAEMAFYFSYVFLSMDTNDNGQVDDEEFFLNYSAIMPVPIEELDDGEALLEAEFTAYDGDKNGHLSQDEFVARYTRNYQALDSDNSGALTLDEFTNHQMAVDFVRYEGLRM